MAMSDLDLLSQVCQSYRHLLDSFMNEVDTHRAQGMLLCRLYNQDGITQSEIGEQLCIQGATATSMLQRMEEAGLVIRRRDEQDNRLVRVYLTEAGRKKEQDIHAQFHKLESAIFEGIPEEDRETLRRLLAVMITNMAGTLG